MVEQGHQPGGWNNAKAFPLLVSRDTEAALIRLQADRGMTRGKALNIVIQEGLMSLNYLARPKDPEQLRKEAIDREERWVMEHSFEMSPKAVEYWSKRYPQYFMPVSPP